MTLVQLMLLGLKTIAELAINPVFGLNQDGARVAALVGIVAKLGGKGKEAIPELRAFTDEIKALADSGKAVDPSVWDALTAHRHAQLEELQSLRGD